MRIFKLALAVAAGLLISCKSKDVPYMEINGFAEGTSFHIVYKDPEERDLRNEIQGFFAEFENSLSIYEPHSLVSQINRNETDSVDTWLGRCFELAEQVSEASDGRFDITLRPLISAYGFGGEGDFRELTDSQRDSMLQFVGYRKVRLQDGRIIKDDPRIQLDFNAIAKGYSSDLLAEMMDGMGIKDYMIEVGGEIFCRGANPRGKQWRVAIDRPVEGNYIPGNDIQTELSLTDRGLATSGNYRKFVYNEAGEMVGHTIDPLTGKFAAHNLLSATIIAPTCALADGYATACMVIGLEKSMELLAAHPELEGYLIYSDKDGNMRIYITRNIQGRINQ